MKYCFLALLAAVMVAGGCASKQSAMPKSGADKFTSVDDASVSVTNKVAAVPSAKKPESDTKMIVTPENILVGTVTTYNTAGRFVVLDFPVGRLPATDQVLFIYRQGLKVGEVKIVGPERDHMTVADLIAGEARKGDEVRDK